MVLGLVNGLGMTQGLTTYYHKDSFFGKFLPEHGGLPLAVHLNFLFEASFSGWVGGGLPIRFKRQPTVQFPFPFPFLKKFP